MSSTCRLKNPDHIKRRTAGKNFPFTVWAGNISMRIRDATEIVTGDRIRLLADVEGVSDGEKIRFELYYRTPDGQTIEFASKSGIIIDGTGTAEWIADIRYPGKRIQYTL